MMNAAISSSASRNDGLSIVSTPVGALPSQRAAHRDEMVTSRGSQLRVLLADPEQELSRSLSESLAAIGVSDVTTVSTLDEVGSGMAPSGDLAVISLRFGQRALTTITALRSASWQRVLALTAPMDTALVCDALQAGATGILISHRRSGSTTPLPTSLFELSDREVEVITLVADGRSNKWIGERLHLSGLTVKSHLARIGRKLGTGDRARIVQLAMEAGVIR